MNRLVRADLKRILSKKGIYAVLLIMLLVVIFRKPAETAADEMEFYRTFYHLVGLTLICIPIFLSVYSDEIKSGIMVSVVGMGMPRKRIVTSKLRVCLILLSGTYLLLFLTALIKSSFLHLGITPRQTALLLLFCFFCVIRGIGILALASLVLFLTMSASGGMLVLIITGVTASGVLKSLQNFTRLPFYDMSYIGLLDDSFAKFQNGSFGFAFIPAIIYLLAVIYINIKVFERKEIDL